MQNLSKNIPMSGKKARLLRLFAERDHFLESDIRRRGWENPVKEMVSDGLVKEFWRDPSRGPVCRAYQITEKGNTANARPQD